MAGSRMLLTATDVLWRIHAGKPMKAGHGLRVAPLPAGHRRQHRTILRLAACMGWAVDIIGRLASTLRDCNLRRAGMTTSKWRRWTRHVDWNASSNGGLPRRAGWCF